MSVDVFFTPPTVGRKILNEIRYDVFEIDLGIHVRPLNSPFEVIAQNAIQEITRTDSGVQVKV